METFNTAERIIMILLKEPFADHTAASLARTLNITRQGLWKVLNKLTQKKLIFIRPVAETKNSVMKITLNWGNPITEKTLSLLLTKESLNYERWRFDFADLENYASFLILFGSILKNPKEANDIDLLLVVKNKNVFNALSEKILKIQLTQLKKVHNIDLTNEEIISELSRPNKAYLDALKKGVVLYGQENFVNFIKNIQTRWNLKR